MKLPLSAIALVFAVFTGSFVQAQSVKRVPVVFSEGHETEGVDRGRPVVLVAGALGVAPEVFREAFSHVRPAGAGERPEEGQVRENKTALMKALGKYGVTNDKLDAASNYYRYVRSRGELVGQIFLDHYATRWEAPATATPGLLVRGISTDRSRRL